MSDSLSDVALFANMSPEDRAALGRAMVDEQLEAGHVLWKEGTRLGGTHGLYVIREGSLTVSVTRPSGGFATVRIMEPGEVVGIIGLVAPDATRRGTVVAGADSRVSHLKRPAFLSLYHSSARLACAFQLALAKQLVTDLRQVDKALRDAVARRAKGVPLGAVHIG